MVVAKRGINGNKKYTSNAGHFDGHTDTAVRCGAHRPMERIPGFMQSHQMLPLGECTRRIAPEAAMVDDFKKKRKLLTKHNFYLAFARQTDAKKLLNLKTRQGPSTHILGATSSPDPNPYTTSQVEELSYILSYQTQQTEIFQKLLSLNKAQENLWHIYGPVVVILLMEVIIIDGTNGCLADVQGITVQGLRHYSVIDQLLQ